MDDWTVDQLGPAGADATFLALVDISWRSMLKETRVELPAKLDKFSSKSPVEKSFVQDPNANPTKDIP